MSKRVIFACLIHETHTFLPRPTAVADFQVKKGAEILRKRGDGSIVDGFLSTAAELGWEVVPTVDLVGGATGILEDEVLEFFWTEFSTRTRAALVDGVDAIFLCLHGAMATRSHPNTEGEILERIRGLPGCAELPIFGTLDLHGNIPARAAAHANGLVAYAENPHTDARATAVKATKLLQRCLASGQKVRMAWRQAPVIWTPPGTGTQNEPMRSLEAMARAIEAEDPQVWAVNVLAGFSYADTPDTGVSFSLVMEAGATRADEHLDRLVAHTWQARALGYIKYPSATEILSRGWPEGKGPVLLIEASDNIGGGGGGDATGVLRALLAADAQDAVVVINDPLSVQQSTAAGLGAAVRLQVGGRSWPADAGPVPLDVTVVNLTDGRFDLENVNSHLAASSGRHIAMGPCAVVRHRGITLLLTSRKTPPFDLGQLRSQGIEPTRMAIIGVKAAVGHRQAYDPIARASYYVETPGPCASDLTSFTFAQVRRPVFPLDPI